MNEENIFQIRKTLEHKKDSERELALYVKRTSNDFHSISRFEEIHIVITF